MKDIKFNQASFMTQRRVIISPSIAWYLKLSFSEAQKWGAVEIFYGAKMNWETIYIGSWPTIRSAAAAKLNSFDHLSAITLREKLTSGKMIR